MARYLENSFWVGVPHEAIVAIGEDYPEVGEYLGNIALVIKEPPEGAPPKLWARQRYQRHRGHQWRRFVAERRRAWRT